MGVILVIGPSSEPLTTAEAKLHLRVDHSTEDTYIDNLVKSARRHFEQVTNYQLLPATWSLTLDRFPRCGEVSRYYYDEDILLPKYPLRSVTSFEYVDIAGLTQTLTSGTHFQINTGENPQRLQLLYNETWPTTRSDKLAVIFIAEYGYAGASSVPNDIKQCLLEMVAHWYFHRGEENGRGLPSEVEELVLPYCLDGGI